MNAFEKHATSPTLQGVWISLIVDTEMIFPGFRLIPHGINGRTTKTQMLVLGKMVFPMGFMNMLLV